MPSASLNPRMLIANPLELRGGSLDAADLQTSHVFPSTPSPLSAQRRTLSYITDSGNAPSLAATPQHVRSSAVISIIHDTGRACAMFVVAVASQPPDPPALLPASPNATVVLCAVKPGARRSAAGHIGWHMGPSHTSRLSQSVVVSGVSQRETPNLGLTGLLQRGLGIAGGALEADRIRYWLGGVRHHSFPTTLYLEGKGPGSAM
jgi:hypothetical protein